MGTGPPLTSAARRGLRGDGRRRCRPRRAGEDRARPPPPFPRGFPRQTLRGRAAGGAFPQPSSPGTAGAAGGGGQGSAAQRSAHPRRCAGWWWGGELPAGLAPARGWVWGRGWGWGAWGGVAALPACSPRPPRGGSPCGGAGGGWGCAAARRWRRCSAAPRRRQASGGRGAPPDPGPARSPLGSPGAAPLPPLPLRPLLPVPPLSPPVRRAGLPPPPATLLLPEVEVLGSQPDRRVPEELLLSKNRRLKLGVYPPAGSLVRGGPRGDTALSPKKPLSCPGASPCQRWERGGVKGLGASRLPDIKLAWGLSA